MNVERLDVPGDPPVRGLLHFAAGADGLVLTHGAGGSRDTPLLVAVAEAFAGRGVSVLRCDLPFRQARARGAPSPAGAARDREGLRAALCVMRTRVSGRLFLGGHSYGGRQASMLLAEEPALASALLLQSYPLHPPGRPQDLRTAHWPKLRVPTLFVQGATDPFATPDELEAARALVPASTRVLSIAAGHDLGWAKARREPGLPARIADTFLDLVCVAIPG
ncbi:MAG TPA: alpha/beta family hydrolase [Methylomirabilota bacterium]|nr:alpha/beta family hydrolase [Methylomirabilota bacterium]